MFDTHRKHMCYMIVFPMLSGLKVQFPSISFSINDYGSIILNQNKSNKWLYKSIPTYPPVLKRGMPENLA